MSLAQGRPCSLLWLPLPLLCRRCCCRCIGCPCAAIGRHCEREVPLGTKARLRPRCVIERRLQAPEKVAANEGVEPRLYCRVLPCLCCPLRHCGRRLLPLLSGLWLLLLLLLLALAADWGCCLRCCCCCRPSCCRAGRRLLLLPLLLSLLPLLLPVMLKSHAVQVLQPAHPRGAVADLLCVNHVLWKAYAAETAAATVGELVCWQCSS